MVMDRIEVITSVQRRRRWSATEKARLVAAMNEPGAVVTEIARSAGVVASLLYRWRRQFAAERETTAFVPVRVSPDPNEAVATTAPVCAPPCKKLKIPFFDYLGDRLGIPGPAVPNLATLVCPAPA